MLTSKYCGLKVPLCVDKQVLLDFKGSIVC